MGVKKSSISRYESNERVPSRSTARKIADYGNVSIDWLLWGEEKTVFVNFPKAHEIKEHAPDAYTAARPAEIQEYLFVEVLRVVEDYIKINKLRYDQTRRGRLIAKLYNHCAQELDRPSLLLAEKYDTLIF